MFFQNKRGMTQLQKILGIMALILFVAAALFFWVKDVVEDITFWKNYYAKDTAMIIELLHASQGDVEINYNALDASKLLEFVLKKDSIVVHDYNPKVDRSKLLPTPFRFAHNNKITVEEGIVASTNFKIIKESNLIYMTEEVLKPFICPSLPNTKADITTLGFFIDSGEDNSLRLIGGAVERHTEKATKELADISLSFQYHNEPNNVLRFYYPNNAETRKSLKLACLVKNKLIRTLPEHFTATETLIMPENNNKLDVVRTDKTALYIELGSDQNDLGGKENKVTEAVEEAIEDYLK